MSNYKHNTKYGILYKSDQDISKYLTQDVKHFQHISNQHSMNIDTKFKVLLLHTVGDYCDADCDFCCSVKERQKTKINVDKVVEMIQDDIELFHEEITLALTGGEPLHFYDEVIQKIKPLFRKVNISIFTSLFVNDFKYQSFITNLKNYLIDDKIDNVRICLSLDYGSEFRHSTKLNMNTEDVFLRTKELIETFKDYDNFHVQIYNVFTSHFKKDKMIELFNWFNANKKYISSITYNMVREFKEGTPDKADVSFLQKLTRDMINRENILFTRFSYISIIGDRYIDGEFKYLDSQQLKLIELGKDVYKTFAGNFCPMYAKIQLTLDTSLQPGMCFHLFDVYKEYDNTVYDTCEKCPSVGSCGYCAYFRKYCVDNEMLYKDYLEVFMTEVATKFNSGKYFVEDYIL